MVKKQFTLFDYDDSNPTSIVTYAKNMVGHSFNDLLDFYTKSAYKSYDSFQNKTIALNEDSTPYQSKPKSKGELGTFIEEYFFGYEPNGNQKADFAKADIELKVTPIDILKNKKMTAGERLVITMISYKDPVIDDFFQSHVWDKIKQILLVHYIREKDINRYDCKIKYVNLFTPPAKDLKIIMDDYKKIISKIKEGKAHELSEADTLYLGACTKGSTALKSQVPQFYGDHTIAKKRAFCFKTKYMNYVLDHYIKNNKDSTETIIKDFNDLKENSFEEFVISQISQYYGKSDSELMDQFNIKQNKSTYATIVYRILGITGNKAEEFVKANIKIKAIRVEENGSVNEHMPFPTFKFKELINQEFEDSDLYEQIFETKYLIVLFYKNGDDYYLSEALFWNMSSIYMDTIKKEWELVRDTVINGVEFTIKDHAVQNNLLSASQSQIIHVRPHTSKSAYKLHNGFEKGDINKDADQLPDGQYMTKQCFWINKDFLIDQIITNKKK